MSTRVSKKIRLGLVLLIGVTLVAGLWLQAGEPAPVHAAPPMGMGMVCRTHPTNTFDLTAGADYISFPDGGSMLIWSYSPTGGPFQFPGPVLCVTQGATVHINLTNTLPDPVSIIFPGQNGVTASGGTPGLFTNEAAPVTGTVSYQFAATEPGTYIYESGTNPDLQVQMGLSGVIVVRPAGHPNWAYEDSASAFNPEREFLLMLDDKDPDLHLAMQRGQRYDTTLLHDRYWTVTGRAHPDNMAMNGAPWLPTQPYGAMVTVEPYDASINPLPALVRYVNVSSDEHPWHPHGAFSEVIARDGRRLTNTSGAPLANSAFTLDLGTGQTADVLMKWYDDMHFDSTTRTIQGVTGITVPDLSNQIFMDNEAYWSGSPYLGEKGPVPVDVLDENICGEYYFPWHSHALDEMVNYDLGMGGLFVMFRIDPPGGCP